MSDTKSSLELPQTRRLLRAGIDAGWQLGGQIHLAIRRDADGYERVDLVEGERAPGQPMTVDTLNLWLSASKPVTAVALARLWERDLLDLDDPIARFWIETCRLGIQHNLTHRPSP